MLLNPLYLKIPNSFLSMRFIKNNCVDNKKIKGSISNKRDGVFNKDKKIR
tara:strand:- start:160 stop:309 length:150 start_codon:yes stop_codon:yes gene_type:complete